MSILARRSRPVRIPVLLFAITLLSPWQYSAWLVAEDDVSKSTESDESTTSKAESTSVEEARIRARILHEAFHGSLQVMHRDYFREDEKLTLPSRSLEDVFSELKRSQQIELRWIAVNASAMSADHKAQDDFEKAAVKAISSGKKEFERVEQDTFRYAGSIRLASQCLKCHVRNRTSNEDRAAGLVITIPLKKQNTSADLKN